MFDVLVIGAGASGILASIYAAKQGKKVLLLERNNMPLKKLYATGNGHCNYLNTNDKDYDFLNDHLTKLGIVGIKEELGRCYPRNRESKSVASILLKNAEKEGVEIKCDTHVTDVQKTDQGFKVICNSGDKYLTKKLCISTGGKAGIQYGCYGEGYRWASYLGHRLNKPIPALVPLKTSEDISILYGVRIKANAKLFCDEKEIASEFGEVQFAKDSISGICIMDLSRFLRLADDKQYVLKLDLFQDISEENLTDIFEKQSSLLGNDISSVLPEKMNQYILSKLGKDVSPKKLAKLSKNLCFEITASLGWSDAQVTCGGILLDEIDQNTFESKKIPGLYFTGEILDFDGPCGGYNLGFAFKSGILAGLHLGK